MNQKSIPAAILAGGLGTRLLPMTSSRPKVMIEVEGKPFLQYVLELLRYHDIDRIVLCVGHLGEQIRRYIGDGSWLGLQVHYSFDQSTNKSDELLGTAGAIRNALPKLGNHFWVINGDTYLDADYQAIYQYYQFRQVSNLMVVYKNRNQWWPSNAVLEENMITRYSKRYDSPQMQYIDTGVGILDASVFHAISNIHCLSSLYERLAVQHDLGGYETSKRFYEINTHASFQQACAFLQSHHPYATD